MLNTLIFSLGIVGYLQDQAKEKIETEDIGNVGILAMLHAIGGWASSGEFFEIPLEDRKAKYIEANATNYETLKSDEQISKTFADDNILNAVKYCYEFQAEQFDFFASDSKAGLYAKIVCVASYFDEAISGIWGSSRTAREVVDVMYVKVQSQKMPKHYVDALAKSLQFTDLFDFYRELEILDNSCKREAGKAYPMTGFKSPIIFVCQQNLNECKEYVASANVINVFKEMGGLEEGQYNRCEGLSERLIKFYEEHYKEIKQEVMAKQFGLNKEDDDDEATAPERNQPHDQGAKTEEAGENKNEAKDESKEAGGDPADKESKEAGGNPADLQ